MPKRNRVDEAIDRLGKLRYEAHSAEAQEQLRAGLRDASNFVVAKAARVIGEAGVRDLVPELEAAFDRLVEAGASADKTCQGKTSIVRALMQLGAQSDDVYLKALRIFQPEKGFGPPVDTAAEMRAAAAVAMAETMSPHALEAAVDLLADPETQARIGAIRALVANSSQASALLLRFKARLGDTESEVMSECLSALLDMSRDSLPFVAGFLHDEREEMASIAALAIGQSHAPGALAALQEAYAERLSLEFRKTVVVAASMLRSDESFEFLLSIIRESAPTLAAEALTSVVAYVVDQRTQSAVEQAVRDNGSRQVRDAFTALSSTWGG